MKAFAKQLHSVALMALLVVGCQKDNKVAPTQDNEPVSVKVNQSARLQQNVTLNVDGIEDSRCPANANCVWYGNVKVKFTLKNDSQTQSAELCLGQCDPQKKLKDKDVLAVQLGGSSYEVTLTEVRPYPGTQPQGTPQEAVIQISKK